LQPSILAKRVYLFLLLAILAFYFFGLGALPLVGPDEPRYAQVAREMFLRNDYVTPTLGGHTWFEKPALLYWMMMLAFRSFGVSEWSARLGPAVCGVLTVLSVWWMARSLEHQRDVELRWMSLWASISTATCMGLIVFSRAASFDVVITMTVSWALTFFLLYELSMPGQKKTFLLAGFYAFVGLSLIAKGLVGIVVPGGVVFVYYILRRRFPERGMLVSLFWGIPIAIAVASIWYGPVIAKHGHTFIQEFFIEHHFARYLSNKYHHPQPLYFYPAIILLLTLPWTPVLIEALLKVRSWSWREHSSLTTLRVFALAWVLFPLVFFSFSGSKLPGYILPVLPAAGLLIGERLSRATTDLRAPRWPLVATGIFCLLLSVSGVVYALKTKQVSWQCAVLTTVPLLVAGLYTVVWTKRRDVAVASVALAICLMAAMALKCAAPVFGKRESVRDLLRVADERGYAGVPVLAQRGDDRSTEFYASGRVIYRADGEVLPIDEVSIDQARKIGRMLVFVSTEHLDYFRKVPGIELLGDNGRVALLGWTPR
jgi:4-amino-4-deoxy-L-arabinose transferase-like glycosyltransferase